MKVHEVIADAYVRRGGKTFFGLLGEGNLKLASTLVTVHGAVMHTARHEQGAVALADGYARVTGRPTLAVVTAGPGLANAGVSVASAVKAHSPVLILAGDSPTHDPSFFQRMDQRAWARGLETPIVQVSQPDELHAGLREAWRYLDAGHAVLLSIPMDVQDAEAPEGAFDDWAEPAEAMLPADDMIAEAAARLRGAERPVILVGRGVRTPEARAAVSRLAAAVGAPIATSLGAAGAFHGDPLELGLCGGFDPGAVVGVVSSADVALVVGSSLSRYTTRDGRVLAVPAVIRLDNDKDAPSENVEAELTLYGDARATLSAIAERLEGAPAAERAGKVAAGRARIADSRREHVYTFEPTDRPGAIDPRTIITKVEAAVPHPRHLALDGGHFTTFAAGLMSWEANNELLFGLSWGAIGQGLLLGIGAAAAAHDEGTGARTLVMAGDGGFLMNLQELETAARLGFPLGVIVFNDQAYGYEVHMLNMYRLDPEIARVPTPDLAAVAKAVGGDGEVVDDPAQLDGMLERMASSQGLYLADVRIDGAVQNWRVQELIRNYRATH